jgi:hypothetical protein
MNIEVNIPPAMMSGNDDADMENRKDSNEKDDANLVRSPTMKKFPAKGVNSLQPVFDVHKSLNLDVAYTLSRFAPIPDNPNHSEPSPRKCREWMPDRRAVYQSIS